MIPSNFRNYISFDNTIYEFSWGHYENIYGPDMLHTKNVLVETHAYVHEGMHANPYLEDPYAEMDNIDWKAVLDNTLHFRENLRNLEEEYPEYRWRVPPKKEALERIRHEWKKLL